MGLEVSSGNFKNLIMKQIQILGVILFGLSSLNAQQVAKDSIVHTLSEVIVVGNAANKHHNENKSLATIEDYLSASPSVDFIKRGAYAWEPLVQGMATERSVVTIDGMRIYGACTDKMDPITSYIEISNLSKATISTGQQGAENGATIAGGIDLERRKSGFRNTGWKGSVQTGLESVNEQKIVGAALQYSSNTFFSDVDVMYRNAENYSAGGGEEVLYSQFTKYNISTITGYKWNDNQWLEASVIFDEARDVGYSALPMDVSLARAFIGSVEYITLPKNENLAEWKTKVYYNTITHIMDDSKRPDVPIRMNMPGWSKTVGMYSKLEGTHSKHRWNLSVNAHYNNSLAEMTMFPENPEENDMFMLTWPDVGTLYAGVFAEDNYVITERLTANFSIGLGVHHNSINDIFGLQSLQIFYPEMEDSKTRFLINSGSKLTYQRNSWTHSLGLGYGERAPSVSEGYGIYLFNSFDAFDYIGNPEMVNEKSMEFNASTAFKNKSTSVKFNSAFYHISDYIIGKPDPDLSPMNIGINGVKVYEQLSHAQLWSTDLSVSYQFLNNFTAKAKAIYRLGKDNNNENLPLIQPFTFETGLRYRKNMFYAEASLESAARQYDFSPEFGENQTPGYTIVNLALSQTFYIDKQKMVLKAGAENLFDENYSTYADWNNIPRPGRNIYASVVYAF